MDRAAIANLDDMLMVIFLWTFV